MKNKCLVLLILYTLFCHQLYGQNTGVTVLDFLKLDAGVKQSAVGGAGSALINNSSGLFYNPALTVFNENNSLYLFYDKLYEDIQHSAAAFSFKTSPGLSLGIGTRYFNSGDISVTTKSSPLGTGSVFSQKSLSFIFNFAVKSGDSFSGGINFKYISDKIDINKTDAIALDIGFIKKIESITLGLSARNIGKEITYYKDKEKLPSDLTGGLDVPILKDKLDFFMDYNYSINEKRGNIFGGAEYIYDFLRLRAGYNSSYSDGSNISCGFGIDIKNFSLDYTFLMFDRLDNVHKIGFNFSFKPAIRKKRQELHFLRPELKVREPYTAKYKHATREIEPGYWKIEPEKPEEKIIKYPEYIKPNKTSAALWYRKKGVILYNNKEYSEAIEFLEKAAELNPRDYESQLLLGECYEKTGKLNKALLHYNRAIFLLTR